MPAEPRRVKELFAAALDLPDPQARQALLDRECADDSDLRNRLGRLLAAHDQPDSALEKPFAAAPNATIDAPADLAGTVVAGRYKLLEEIGEGGMGTVWMAEQREPVKRLIALKLIKPGMDSRAVLARFEAERQALALMDHPNIARVLDGGTTAEGRPYFVMELVKGLPLTEYCDDRRLSVRARLDLFVQVCSAVQHAHQKGVIHRDLKPSNILVTEHDGKPVPKVIDFGLAKALHSLHALTERTLYTSFGTMVGTPLYMAPEQVGINALDVDTRTDIYALGVILYELLTGTTPLEKKQFRDAAWDEMRRLIREEEAPRPSVRLSTSNALPSLAARRQIEPAKLSRLVRGELDWIVLKALEKDRNRRYETANGMAMDVQRHLADEPVLACPPSAAYRLRKFTRKHRAGLTAAAAFAALLLLGVAVSAWQAIRAKHAEQLAVAARDAEITERLEAEQQRDRASKAEADAKQQRDQAVAEKKRADEEAAVAQAVNDFLRKDLLHQAGPEQQVNAGFQPDPDIKIRTLLDRAATKVGDRFKDSPRVEAMVRQAIAWAYHELGLAARGQQWKDLLAAAEMHQTRAIELLRKALGDDHPDTLSAIYHMGAIYANFSQFAKAEPYFVRDLEGRRRTVGAANLQTAMAMNNLGFLYRNLGREVEAEKLFREALEAAQRLPGGEKTAMQLMANLGSLCARQERLVDAERLLRQALDGKRRLLGDKDSTTQITMVWLARVYTMQNRHVEAEDLLRANLQAVRTNWGAEHMFTAKALDRLGRALVGQCKYGDAEPLLRECLTIHVRENPDAWETWSVRSLLGGALAGQQKYAEAEPLLLEGYEGLRQRAVRIPADSKSRLTEAVDRLVQLFESTGKPEEADKWRAERAKYAASPGQPPVK